MAKQLYCVILVELNGRILEFFHPKIIGEETPDAAISKLLSSDIKRYENVIQAFAFPVKGSRFKITRYTGYFSGSPNFMIERTE